MSTSRLAVGNSGHAQLLITETYCTQRGNHKIFSTPNMVMLLERAAIEALRPALTEDQISVGTLVNVQHLAPTLLGMNVKAVATVQEVDGSRVVLDVQLYDDTEKVGQATHERYLLDLDRYVRRLERKAGQWDGGKGSAANK